MLMIHNESCDALSSLDNLNSVGFIVETSRIAA